MKNTIGNNPKISKQLLELKKILKEKECNKKYSCIATICHTKDCMACKFYIG